jgi:PAS domain S-box-containing protein
MGSSTTSGNTRTVVAFRSASVSVTIPSLHARAFDAAPIAMAILDTELRYLHVNRAMAVLNGLAAEEHLGRRISEVFPDLDDSLLATLGAVAAGGEPVPDHELVADVPGRPGPSVFIACYQPLAEPDGHPSGVLVTVTEVTVERRHTRYLEALQTLASGLGIAVSPEDVAATTLDVVLGTLGADRGAVSLVAPDGRHLDVVGVRGYRPGELTPGRLRRPIEADDPLAEVSRTGDTLLFETDADAASRYPAFERRRPG